MEAQTIMNLVESYQDYPNSVKFIYAAVEALSPHRDTRNVKHFIKNAFIQNKVDVLDGTTCKNLSIHWKNVAMTKLENNDFRNYFYCINTASNFEVVSKFLELNDN